MLPLAPTLDTPGPITRSAEDAALLYQVLQGPDPLDVRTLGHKASDPMRALRRGVRGLRLARIPEAEREGVSAEVLAAYDQALEILARAGASIEAIRLPCRFDDYAAATNRIMQSEAYALVGELADDPALPLDDAVRPRVLAGAKVSARDYLRALREREALKQPFEAALADSDALLTPTTATTAIPIEAVNQDESPARFTRFVNLLELCGLAVPNGFTEAGLPTSLQIVCRGYEEGMALRIGWAYQSMTDWHERVPPGV